MKTSTSDLEALSDNSLMLKVRDGDLDRLGLLFERYKRPLCGFFYGMNKDQELSEDLVQNTFLRILKYRHLFRGEGDFKTWMFHIARNVRFDHHRKNKVANARDDLEHWQDRLGHNENKSSEMEVEEEHQMLSMAMDRLPEEKREVLLLSKYQEKKYKEIGELLGCSEGDLVLSNIQGALELTNYDGEITAENISGSVVATTYNGEIKVTFDKVKEGTPMSYSTYNGMVGSNGFEGLWRAVKIVERLLICIVRLRDGSGG